MVPVTFGDDSEDAARKEETVTTANAQDNRKNMRGKIGFAISNRFSSPSSKNGNQEIDEGNDSSGDDQGHSCGLNFRISTSHKITNKATSKHTNAGNKADHGKDGAENVHNFCCCFHNFSPKLINGSEFTDYP